jgi:hypothetical protein
VIIARLMKNYDTTGGDLFHNTMAWACTVVGCSYVLDPELAVREHSRANNGSIYAEAANQMF